MSDERNRRKVRQGVVVSTAGDKTCVVKVEERKKHPLYGKMITQSNEVPRARREQRLPVSATPCTIMETRPLSKLKRWRLVEIVEKAK